MITTKKDEYWYLSFVQREGPDPRWLGATVVKAESALDAVREAKRLGCNPGGEVLMKGLDVDETIPDGIVNHLVQTEDEMRLLFARADGRDPIVNVSADQLPGCMECEREVLS